MSGCHKESIAPKPERLGLAENSESEVRVSGVPDLLPFAITDSGLLVYWESEKDPAELAALGYEVYDRETIETWWIEAQQCLGLEAEPAIVRIVDDVRDLCPGFSRMTAGAYCEVDGIFQILIETGYAYNDYTPLWDVVDDRRVWKHEFTHHLAEANGIEGHWDHGGPDYLWQCQHH